MLTVKVWWDSSTSTSFVDEIWEHTIYREACQDIMEGAQQRCQKYMVKATMQSLPLCTIILFSKGSLMIELLDLMIDIMNGKYLLACCGFCSLLVRFIQFKQ